MIAMPQNPLPDLIGRLLREPLVWIVLVSWIAGGIGKILQAKKKRDAALGRTRGAGDRLFDWDQRGSVRAVVHYQRAWRPDTARPC